MSRADRVREVLTAVVHCATQGVRLQATSPIAAIAEELLTGDEGEAVIATPAPAPILPQRPGLTAADRERRRGTLGSSEIASIVGVNPYASMHDVWASKVLGVEIEENEAMTLGNILEPTIFAIYAERYNRVLRKGSYVLGPEPWMSATPDAYIEGGGLVEAKLVGIRTLYQWGAGNTEEKESDSIPLHYLCQAQWQMAITGEPFVDVSALMGTEFRSYTIRSDAALQAKLIARGRDFWTKYVVPKIAPPIDGSKGAREMLKALYPRSVAEPIEATEKLERLVGLLREARAAAESANFEKARRENEIKAELKEASGAFSERGGWRIRYATTKTGSRPFCFDDDKSEGRAA